MEEIGDLAVRLVPFLAQFRCRADFRWKKSLMTSLKEVTLDL